MRLRITFLSLVSSHVYYVTAFVLLLLVTQGTGKPSPAQYFRHQRVDHFSTDVTNVWTQRYYASDVEFRDPGSPIFVILGGEGAIPPTVGLFYPFITDHLAKMFGAYVVQPEHRFYGESQPLETTSKQYKNSQDDHDPRVNLFTSEQALYDAMYLLEYIQDELNCTKNDRSSSTYCPVITVGGSYPGFLSAMARIMFPSKVDMAYAASPPMMFYSQHVNQYDYYNHITKVAEQTIPGCANAVRTTLKNIVSIIHQILTPNNNDMKDDIENKLHLPSTDIDRLHTLEHALGICEGTIPRYCSKALDTSEGQNILIQELMMVVGYSFANDNMANYPPNNTTRLYNACEVFLSSTSPTKKIREFLVSRVGNKDCCNSKVATESSTTNYDNAYHDNKNNASSCPCKSCWNMTHQLPTGPNATISGGDWSGDGIGSDGESWDFQTCTLLIEAIGFSNESMFYPQRNWSIDWLSNHCSSRFGVKPDPIYLVNKWKFDKLVETNVTHILFTNGNNDGWSVGGIKSNLSDTLIVMNFPNGAHHSDLSSPVSPKYDTDDIIQGHQLIKDLFSTWLDEIFVQRKHSTY